MDERMEKFTPGPWEAENCSVRTTREDLPSDRTWGYGLNDGFICSLDDGEYHNYSDQTECSANAQLIAAAPEMYELLKQLYGALASVPLLQVEIEKVLKKARGEK